MWWTPPTSRPCSASNELVADQPGDRPHHESPARRAGEGPAVGHAAAPERGIRRHPDQAEGAADRAAIAR
jgi:hypothetical protein